MRPRPFSDGVYAQWIRRFEICSDANKWDNATALVRLPDLLQVRAFSVFEKLDLSQYQLKSYSTVKAGLLNVFEPNTEERYARCHLQQRQLGKSEDVDIYVYQLERLLDHACPGIDTKVRDRELLNRLMDGLLNEIREKILLVQEME